MMNSIQGYIAMLSFCILICISCAYDPSGENFREVAKPEPINLIDFLLIPEGDTIVIYRDTEINYNILFDKGVFLKATLTSEESEQVNYNNPGSFTIEAKRDNSIIKYRLTAIIGTGSGSLADQLEAEGVYVEKEWYVKMAYLDAESFNLHHHINADGFLEFSWENIGFTGIQLEYPKQRDLYGKESYVDKYYIGGDQSYIFQFFLGQNSFSKEIKVNYPLPSIHVDNREDGSFLISWENSDFDAIYSLLLDSDPLVTNTRDTFYILDSDYVFGKPYDLQLRIIPAGSNSAGRGVHKKFTYDAILIDESRANYFYDRFNNRFIFQNEEKLHLYNGDNLAFDETVNIPPYSTIYATPTDCSFILFNEDSGLIDVYDCDYNLEKATSLNLEYVTYWQPINKGKIAFSRQGMFHIYDLDNDKMIYSGNENFPPRHIVTNSDASLIAYSSVNSLKVLSHKMDNSYELKELPEGIRSILYHEDTDTFILEYFDHNLEQWDLNQGLQKKELIVNGSILNIDPTTGYLLYQDLNSCHIYDIENDKIIKSIEVLTPYEYLLYNNFLINREYALFLKLDI